MKVGRMRGISRRLSSDEGMTLIEVVIAAAILFIILTGVLGLLGQTIMMGNQAKGINVETNAVNTYVEWVRAQPFSKIIESGAGGSIEATTVVVGEYTVSIDPVVEEGENDSLKNLILSVTVTRHDGHSYSYQTTVVIRDRDQHMTSAKRDPTTDPKISFVAPTPPDGTVVWYEDGGSWWMDEGGNLQPLQFAVSVMASEGRTVKQVELVCDDAFQLANTAGDLANWPEPEWTLMPTPFSWDIMQTNAIGERRVADGTRSVQAYVMDSDDVRVYAMRQYLVDNDAPTIPEDGINLTHDPAGSMAGTLTWDVVSDGGSDAFGYVVHIKRQGIDGTWAEFEDSPFSVNVNRFSVPGEPLARFDATVYAASPLGRMSEAATMTPFVTRPTLATTTYLYDYQNVNKWDVTATLRCSPPSFPVVGDVIYRWYRADTNVLLATTTNDSTYVAPLVANALPSYYVTVSLTPVGGAATTLRSETVRVLKHTADGTYAVAPGVW